MQMAYGVLLIVGILAGQLIKIPIGIQAGPTLLDIIVILLSIIGLFKLIKAKIDFKKIPIFYLWGFGFSLLGIFSLSITPLHLNTFEYFVSFSYALRFGSYLFLGLLINYGIFPEIKQHIEKILLYSGVGLAVLGLGQLLLIPNLGFLIVQGWDPHYFRTVSTFLDPNFVGAYLALTLSLILTSKLPKNLQIIMFIVTYLALVTTFSRGAFLAFLGIFITLSAFNKSLKLLLLTIILSLGFILGFSTYKQEVATPRNIDRNQSAEFRLSAWQQGITIWQNYPILGVGFNSYRYAIRELNLGGDGFVNSRGSSTNDSALLFVAATTGVIGEIIYIGFLLSIIWLSFKNYLQKNIWGIRILAAGVGLFAQSFFSDNLFYPFFLIWIALATSQLEVSEKVQKK